MPTDQRSSESSPRGRTIMDEMQSLLSALLGLYSQISSRILSDRLSTQRGPTTPRDGLPIGDLLDDHIEQTAAASVQSGGSHPEEKPSASRSASDTRPITTPDKAGTGRSGSGLFGALSGYFGRHRNSSHSAPLVREKMRANTLDHINRAMILAKRGDAKGAKVHATLAESAMRTAGEYMSDEEYSQFKEQVESRVKAAGRPPTQV